MLLACNFSNSLTCTVFCILYTLLSRVSSLDRVYKVWYCQDKIINYFNVYCILYFRNTFEPVSSLGRVYIIKCIIIILCKYYCQHKMDSVTFIIVLAETLSAKIALFFCQNSFVFLSK